MFTAKGMAVKRGSGEVITPYYFALEDLQEDWAGMVEKAKAGTVRIQVFACPRPRRTLLLVSISFIYTQDNPLTHLTIHSP